MSELDARLAALSPDRLLLVTSQLQQRLRRLEDAAHEPIAVVGIGCRFPQAATPEEFWNLLASGRDTIAEVPAERWDINAWYDPDPDADGRMYARHGSFLNNVDLFDAPFFGIAPREVLSMDPQQRLLLETSWEALERAGAAGDKLRGSRTGVFVGITSSTYGGAIEGDGRFDAYSGTGNALCVAAGRVSFCLGLQGPSMAVDTACSSSLVAVDMACRYLRTRQCDAALAGGVNLTLSPEFTIYFCKFRALSRIGRCATFDASADGYVRGEGCGMLMLKRLSDAVAADDPIVGVIAGSAVNHDGRTSGLTVPNRHAQVAVIRQALSEAKISPHAVGYVEAHGTGTQLGDPIELSALGEVFGERPREAGKLLVGAVKTNIGHTESAAGVAGLIKVLLSLQHDTLPAHLNLSRPTPHAAWDRLPLEVTTKSTPWKARGAAAPRIAGVSAFGFSGTNAHVLIREAPPRLRKDPTPRRPVHVLCLSAHDDAALAELQTRAATRLSEAVDDCGDLCHAAAAGRSHFPLRQAYVGRSNAELQQQLNSPTTGRPGAADTPTDNAVEPFRAAAIVPALAPWKGRGRERYIGDPQFRAIVDACCEQLSRRLNKPVDWKQGITSGSVPTSESTFVDGVMRLAAAEQLLAWGLAPAAVTGWGGGQIIAARLARAISLDEACAALAQFVSLGNSPSSKSLELPLSSPQSRLINAVSTGKIQDRWSIAANESPRLAQIAALLQEQTYRSTIVVGDATTAGGELATTFPDAHWLWRAGVDEWTASAGLIAACYTAGANIDWQAFDAAFGYRTADWPTYPFQRRSHWRHWTPFVDAIAQQQSKRDATPPPAESDSGPLQPPFDNDSPDAVQRRSSCRLSGTEFYAQVKHSDATSRRVVDSVWLADDAACAMMRLPPDLAAEASSSPLHRALVAGAQQLVDWLNTHGGQSFSTRGPMRVDDASTNRPAGAVAWCVVAARADSLPVVRFFAMSQELVAELRVILDDVYVDTPVKSPTPRSRVDFPDPAHLKLLTSALLTEMPIPPWDKVDRLCRDVVIEALQNCDAISTDDGTDAAERCRRAGVLPPFEPWVRRGRELLTQQGFHLDKHVAMTDAELDKLSGEDATIGIAVETVRSGRRRLADYLRGRCHLWQYADPRLTNRLHRELAASLLAAPQLPQATAMLAEMLQTDDGRPARVLEVNAGIGAMTALVAPLVKDVGVTYDAADASPFLAAYAVQSCAAGDSIRPAVVDLQRPASDEHRGRYELVLCFSSLYAADDAASLLGGCRSLVASGGLLLAAVPSGATPWLDLLFAVGQVGIRSTVMGLSGQHTIEAPWTAWLKAAGFSKSAVLGDPRLPKSLLVAKADDGRLPRSSQVGGPATRDQARQHEQLRMWQAFWSAPLEARRDLLVDELRNQVARLIRGASPTSLDVNRPIIEFGIDSLMLAELRTRLDPVWFGPTTSASLDPRASIASLADRLSQQLREIEPS